MDVKVVENGSKFSLSPISPKVFLEMIPLAAAIWNGPQSLCVLNQSAQRLIGFSEADLLENNRLWSERVYRGDGITFFERQQKMERGNSEITCDYRFYPKKLHEPIWIREVTVPLRDLHLRGRWVSFYSDISDLKQRLSREQQGLMGEQMREVIGCLFHDIKNRLHLLSMELELAVLESRNGLDNKKIDIALHAVNHSLKMLHDYLIPAQTDLTSQD
jgi:hypothetical protein